MTVLRNLNCNVRWARTGRPLSEYCTSYTDGCVETWIEIPHHTSGAKDCQGEFFMQLETNDIIAPGIAMFVYMDGSYQCNRNRRWATITTQNGDKRKQISMKVRQKETFHADGSMTGRAWHFCPVEGGSGEHGQTQDVKEGAQNLPFSGKYAGIIEVVVLRCDTFDRARTSMPIYRTPVGTDLEDFQMQSSRRSQKDENALRSSSGAAGLLHGKKQPDKVRSCDLNSKTLRSRNSFRQPNTKPVEGITAKKREKRTSRTEVTHRKDGKTCSHARATLRGAKNEVWETWSTAAIHSGACDGGFGCTSIEVEQCTGHTPVTHLVQKRQSTEYLHRLAKPKYFDSHRSPYAVFRFHYRGSDALKQIIHSEMKENANMKEENLDGLTREELITQILKLRILNSDLTAAGDKILRKHCWPDADDEQAKGSKNQGERTDVLGWPNQSDDNRSAHDDNAENVPSAEKQDNKSDNDFLGALAGWTNAAEAYESQNISEKTPGGEWHHKGDGTGVWKASGETNGETTSNSGWKETEDTRNRSKPDETCGNSGKAHKTTKGKQKSTPKNAGEGKAKHESDKGKQQKKDGYKDKGKGKAVTLKEPGWGTLPKRVDPWPDFSSGPVKEHPDLEIATLCDTWGEQNTNRKNSIDIWGQQDGRKTSSTSSSKEREGSKASDHDSQHGQATSTDPSAEDNIAW